MSDFKMVRGIYGTGADAKEKYNYIPDGGMNNVLKSWHSKQAERGVWCSPSSLTMCPRVVWLKLHKVEPTNTMGWGTQQRMMLGRQFEDLFAKQLDDEGILLHHWKDNPGDIVEKFSMGKGETLCEGVPDYLLKFNDTVCVSDAKTSRSDSFGYVPIDAPEIWQDGGWYKYKIQLTAYFMLCIENREWFIKHKLSVPKRCHLFSYALDDGIVRREIEWEPSEEEKAEVKRLIVRFNQAMTAKECPACECTEFDRKFCSYGTKTDEFAKVCDACCDDSLITKG